MKLFNIIILLLITINSFSQNLMLGETKRTIKKNMNSSNINWRMTYQDQNTIIYQSYNRKAIYKFNKIEGNIFNKWICNELIVEVPSKLVNSFIKEKELSGCWIPNSDNLWEYNCYKNNCIMVEKIEYKNKSTFVYKEYIN